MADLLRAAKLRPAFLAAAKITLVETSPALRTRQAAALAGQDIHWASAFGEIALDAPLYLVANEFFDALPIRQFVQTKSGVAERFVTLDENHQFAFTLSPLSAAAPHLPHPEEPQSGVSKDEPLLELNEPTRAIAAEIGAALNAQGGLALIVDYGHARSAPGDTLQAVQAHRFVSPLDMPGEADLTAHVDFQALAEAAAATAHGPVTQGAFLTALGIEHRAQALIRARPPQSATIAAALTRLIDPDAMGILFKAMALTGPGGPDPAGFAP